MASADAKPKDPLKPEVMAVQRASFDGYFEPDSQGRAKKSGSGKTSTKKSAAAKKKPR